MFYPLVIIVIVSVKGKIHQKILFFYGEIWKNICEFANFPWPAWIMWGSHGLCHVFLALAGQDVPTMGYPYPKFCILGIQSSKVFGCVVVNQFWAFQIFYLDVMLQASQFTWFSVCVCDPFHALGNVFVSQSSHACRRKSSQQKMPRFCFKLRVSDTSYHQK